MVMGLFLPTGIGDFHNSISEVTLGDGDQDRSCTLQPFPGVTILQHIPYPATRKHTPYAAKGYPSISPLQAYPTHRRFLLCGPPPGTQGSCFPVPTIPCPHLTLLPAWPGCTDHVHRVYGSCTLTVRQKVRNERLLSLPLQLQLRNEHLLLVLIPLFWPDTSSSAYYRVLNQNTN